MQITLTLPDELARQIQILPDRERFVREALQAAIQQRKAPKPLSKWAKIARRIEETSVGLGDYTDKFKQGMCEVRENLIIKANNELHFPPSQPVAPGSLKVVQAL